MKVLGVFKNGFKIRSKGDCVEFCKGLSRGTVDFPDVNDKRFYYTICKDSEGNVTLGRTRYGKDPVSGPPVFLDDQDVNERLYLARKSVNAKFLSA